MSPPAPSVAQQVAARGTAVVVAALALAGVGTGATLHAWRVHAHDEALLAAVHDHAHAVDDDWAVEHDRPRPRVWTVHADDPWVPAAIAADVVAQERPRWLDVGDERVAVVLLERERHGVEDHRVVAAAAPRITLVRSVGGFALAYGVLAALAALAATWTLQRLVRRAFAPLDVARADVARVVALGQHQRVATDAPAEVAGLLRDVNGLLDRLDAAFEAQGRFTAEAAHELRTPVTAMLGELDVALRHPRDADSLRATLVSTREEVDRLRRLVDGLTALVRLDAGEVDRHRELVRAAEVVDAVVAAEGPGLRAAGCALTVDVRDDPELEVHRPLLEAAVGNLLRNAARHAPCMPVSLTLRTEGDLAVFQVDDHGPGLSPADREAVFDRFARGGTARTRDRAGLGLGLPLAREVARRHGGDCVLDTAAAGGLSARLTVRLTRARTAP
ncbi:MAG: HAMP domain-containing histidine kinase [Alphaproteobacteria bacterium]|nr:HAMP domain-containing histidine kinase [Alphaproteobacteria bacterium]